MAHGARRSGRTTMLVRDVLRTLLTTNRSVVVVVHESHFRKYLQDLLTSHARDIGLDETAVRGLLARVRFFNPRTAQSTIRETVIGLEPKDVFVDHVVWERYVY
jgi:hypothetical protein